MTFKECRKYGREQINMHNVSFGYMYKDRKGEYSFSLVYYNSSPPIYVLEKNGVLDKVIDGHWKWDYEKRGMKPQNKKGWNKKNI